MALTYPLALFLLRTRSRWRGVLVALAIAPMLTSTVVRSYGWLMILNNQGLSTPSCGISATTARRRR